MMELHQYPELEAHRSEHGLFLEYIDVLHRKMEAGIKDLSGEMLTFLTIWWEDHIVEMDMHYAPYLQQGPPSD